MQLAENKQEILLGKCESGADLTNTQEHILMLLLAGKLTNAKMAEMQMHSAAVTASKLRELNLIV